MPFRPLRDDHSLNAIAFVIAWDEPLGSAFFEKIAKHHDQWRDELPAARVQHMDKINIDAIKGATVEQRAIGSVLFARYMPDGQPEWSLEFREDSLVCICRLYTRWSRVWRTAFKILSSGLAAIGREGGGDIQIRRVTLETSNVFLQSGSIEEGDLFNPTSEFIPVSLRNKNRIWHVDQGYADTFNESDEILNRFQIHIRLDSPSMYSAHLIHTQTVTFNTHVMVSSFKMETLSQTMEKLHVQTKENLRNTLSERVVAAISLNAPEREVNNA